MSKTFNCIVCKKNFSAIEWGRHVRKEKHIYGEEVYKKLRKAEEFKKHSEKIYQTLIKEAKSQDLWRYI